MVQNTKQELLDYIKNITEIYLRTNEISITTEEIANHFHLSRSLISKHLNSLFDERKLIKISTRPVIYFDLDTINEVFDLSISEYEFISLKEFEKMLDIKRENEFFKEIVGKSSSLKDSMIIVNKILNKRFTGVAMITGERGTGKTILSDSLTTAYSFKYNVDKTKIICTKDYKNYYNDLFGKDGVLTKENKIVLIDDIDKMPLEIQNEISFKINNGICGTNVLIVTATDNQKVSDSLKDIAKYNIALPIFSSKTLKEKENLIYKFLRKYDSPEHPVFISNDALNLLCNLDVNENIKGLIETIDEAYTNARNESVSSSVKLYRYHFPISGNDNTVLSSSKNKVLLSPKDIKEIISFDIVTNTMDSIKSQFYKSVKVGNNEIFVRFIVDKINKYCDHILFNKKTNDNKIKIIEKVLKSIFYIIENDYRLSINYSIVKSFSRILYENTYLNTHIKSWELANQLFVDELEKYISLNYGFISKQLDEIENKLESMLEVKLDILSKLYLFINFIEMNNTVEQYEIVGIIAAHGYSTASSIADTANRMIGVHVFDGIDMPIDIKTVDIVNRIKEYIYLRKVNKEILLLVDMGSLEQIGQEIADTTSNRVAIINNISTKIAMVLGMDIVANKGLTEIVDNSLKASQFSCHIIENKVKKKAIIFSFENGIQITERVMNVFQNSLPIATDINLIALDYMDFLDFEKFNEINSIYNVVLIVGTLNTKVNNIPCIALEDIMTSFNMDRFNKALSTFVDKQDIEMINDNLIRNFSLENILKNVTILNPYILMDLVEDALNRLQRELNVKFTNKVMTGLYIHITSMIERMITKEYEISHANIEEFKVEQSEFIDSFNNSFSTIKQKYKIDISISEIAYLYNYISNGFIYNKNGED